MPSIHSSTSGSKPIYIGVDCGTSSLRVGVFDEIGRLLTGYRRTLSCSFPSRDRSEQSPNEWWEHLVEILRSVIRAKDIASCVQAIGICGTTCTLVPCLSTFDPLGAAI